MIGFRPVRLMCRETSQVSVVRGALSLPLEMGDGREMFGDAVSTQPSARVTIVFCAVDGIMTRNLAARTQCKLHGLRPHGDHRAGVRAGVQTDVPLRSQQHGPDVRERGGQTLLATLARATPFFFFRHSCATHKHASRALRCHCVCSPSLSA